MREWMTRRFARFNCLTREIVFGVREGSRKTGDSLPRRGFDTVTAIVSNQSALFALCDKSRERARVASVI